MPLGVLSLDEYYVLTYPYNVLCTILFIAIPTITMALLAKYATLRKSEFYAIFLTLIGIIEFIFSARIAFLEGIIIGLATIPLGFAVPAVYQLKWNPYKNQGKLLLISSGCIMLAAGSLGVIYRIVSAFPWLILLIAGSYLLIISVAAFFVAKHKPNN